VSEISGGERGIRWSCAGVFSFSRELRGWSKRNSRRRKRKRKRPKKWRNWAARGERDERGKKVSAATLLRRGDVVLVKKKKI